MMTEHLSETYN